MNKKNNFINQCQITNKPSLIVYFISIIVLSSLVFGCIDSAAGGGTDPIITQTISNVYAEYI